MKRKIMFAGLWLIVGVVAVVAFQKLFEEVNLRINGLKGEVSSVSYYHTDSDEPFMEVYLVQEKTKYTSPYYEEKLIEKGVVVRIKPSRQALEEVKTGQWVRVIKNGDGFWHLGN